MLLHNILPTKAEQHLHKLTNSTLSVGLYGRYHCMRLIVLLYVVVYILHVILEHYNVLSRES